MPQNKFVKVCFGLWPTSFLNYNDNVHRPRVTYSANEIYARINKTPRFREVYQRWTASGSEEGEMSGRVTDDRAGCLGGMEDILVLFKVSMFYAAWFLLYLSTLCAFCFRRFFLAFYVCMNYWSKFNVRWPRLRHASTAVMCPRHDLWICTGDHIFKLELKFRKPYFQVIIRTTPSITPRRNLPNPVCG